MPSIMYKLLVNPPAHKGPKMVARPPTERLTPWLNPVLLRKKKAHDNELNRIAHYFSPCITSANLVFSPP